MWENKDYQLMDRSYEGIHRVADILPGFGPGDVGSIPTGSVITGTFADYSCFFFADVSF